MLRQFKQDIDVAIVQGNAQHKLTQLYYVQATTEEAAATYKAHHIGNKWKPSQKGIASWLSEHTPEGYGTFEQFRNGYESCVH